ncbi:MAG: DNA-binding protein [Candidatus Verstraetearchaeota archaeon]|nr:DNA-binding protein [Candidatus Verstraetearchaeota archaeon]
MNKIASGNLVFIRLDDGEEVVSSLKKVVTEECLETAIILSFVGALRHTRLIVRKGVEKEVEHHVEVVGNGNITRLDSEPFIHLHLAVGSDEGSWVGHLLTGTVDIFCEIALARTAFPMKRSYSKELANAGVTVPFRLEWG